MKKFLQNILSPFFTYFLFYIFISTSGIMSFFYLLSAATIPFQEIYKTNAIMISDLNTMLSLGLPALASVLVTYILIKEVRDSRLFFTLTFVNIAISHFLLSFSTGIELGDIRLVIAAIAYLGFISFILTYLRKKIAVKKFSGIHLFLLLIMLGISAIHLAGTMVFADLYVAFAWKLNETDHLFNKLNIDYIYFSIVVLNMFACLLLFSIFYLFENFKKLKSLK